MKKLLYIFMIAAVLVSCKKNTTETPSPVATGEVEFNVTSIFEFTDREYDVPNCNDDLVPTYAKIWLQPVSETNPHIYTEYTADVYELPELGHLYTKALMMEFMDPNDPDYIPDVSNCYRLVGFMVMGEDADGIEGIYKATPSIHSDFEPFVVNGLGQEFCIEKFMKKKIEVDVMCFVPDLYDLFGFFWFEITEITIREICFFGDFCLKDTYMYDYAENLYYQSGGGIYIDEPAIFKIEARHKKPGDADFSDMPGTDFDNKDWKGVGEPLCIRYPDYDVGVDSYEFDLYLWAMTANGMGYVYLYTFEWDDIFEDTYDPGDDGVFEFVVGNCVATETDMLFPPYMILPERVTMQLGFLDYDDPTFPGFYFKWKMTYAEPVDADVYDIPYDAWYGAFCGDAFNQIQPGIPHPLTEVFCTLDDPNDPDFPQCGINFTPELFEKMNYLFNNTRQNGDIDIMYALTPLEGENMQKAIWGVLHSSDGLNPYGWSSAPLMSDPYYPAYNMASMALQHGEDFVILPGGWAGIGFVSPNLVQGFDFAQLILILVDP